MSPNEPIGSGDSAWRAEGEGWQAWYSVCRLGEFPVEADKTALIVIDLSYQQISRDYGLYKRLCDFGLAADAEYAFGRIEQVLLPNVSRLTAAFRDIGAPVIYTTCASQRGDGSDQTWRHRCFGLVCSVDSKDAQIVEEVAPQEGDILLVKTGSSVFNSTNVEHLLRNLGITTVVLTGVWTNSCVESATRDAGDLDFRVIVVEDACAAMSPTGHENALNYLDKNFCHVKSTDEVVALLTGKEAYARAS